MTTLYEAAQQALEAMANIPENIEGYLPETLTDAVIALKAALDASSKLAHTGKPNFCPRCGKRAFDGVHTCTPPLELEPKTPEQIAKDLEYIEREFKC